MSQVIKHNFEFQGIDPRIAAVLESKLSGILNDAIKLIEPNITALNALAEQGLIQHVDIDSLISQALSADSSNSLTKESPEPEATKDNPVKKAAKKKSAKKKVAKKTPAKKTDTGEVKAEKYYFEEGRMVRSPGVFGKPPKEFLGNILEHMKSGDDDQTLLAKHNASKATVTRLRKQLEDQDRELNLGDTADSENTDKPEISEEEKAVSLLKEGKNIVEVSQMTTLDLTDLHRLNKKLGL